MSFLHKYPHFILMFMFLLFCNTVVAQDSLGCSRWWLYGCKLCHFGE